MLGQLDPTIAASGRQNGKTMRRANATVLALLVAMQLTSCRGSDPSETTAGLAAATTTTAAAASAATTTTTTAAATTTGLTSTAATAAESTGAQPLTMGTLPEGTYQTRNFDPTLTFNLPDGWYQYFEEDSDEIALAGPSAEMNLTRPSLVVDPDGGTIDTPDDVADWLLTHSHFVATEEESALVAGVEARVIDVEAPTSTVDFFAYPEGNMRVPAGVEARFVVVPMDGPDLVLVILPSGASLAAAIDATQSIVTSLAIVGGM